MTGACPVLFAAFAPRFSARRHPAGRPWPRGREDRVPAAVTQTVRSAAGSRRPPLRRCPPSTEHGQVWEPEGQLRVRPAEAEQTEGDGSRPPTQHVGSSAVSVGRLCGRRRSDDALAGKAPAGGRADSHGARRWPVHGRRRSRVRSAGLRPPLTPAQGVRNRNTLRDPSGNDPVPQHVAVPVTTTTTPSSPTPGGPISRPPATEKDHGSGRRAQNRPVLICGIPVIVDTGGGL
jgi:hypothetical protein